MASEKATYWVAVGIMAVLLGHHFTGKLDRGCFRGRALYAAERVADSASRVVDRSQGVFDRGTSRYERVQSRVAFAQSRMASVQTLLDSKESALAQAEALREQRVLMLDQVRGHIACPRQRIQVVIPRLPSAEDDGVI
jgi:hypothetical protein